MPFTEAQGVDHPLQFYAATKRANELMAHAYAISTACPAPACASSPSTGPGGGPTWRRCCSRRRSRGPADQALQPRRAQPRLHLCRRHRRGGDPRLRPHRRARSGLGPAPRPTRPPRTRRSASTTSATAPRSALADFVAALEAALGRTAIRELLPLQPGDVPDTYADSSRLARAVELAPRHPGRRGRAPLRRLVPGLLRRARRAPICALKSVLSALTGWNPGTRRRSGARPRRPVVAGRQFTARARRARSAQVSDTSPGCMGSSSRTAGRPSARSSAAMKSPRRHRGAVADVVEAEGMRRAGVRSARVPVRVGRGDAVGGADHPSRSSST